MCRNPRGAQVSALITFARAVATVAIVSAAVPGIARAQSVEAKTQGDDQGNGFKLGDARLHPFADLQLRHAYNPGRVPDAVGPVNDLVFTPRGGAELEYAGSFVQLKVSLEAKGNIYAGLESASSSNLTNFWSELKLDTVFNKEGSFTVGFKDDVKPYAAEHIQGNSRMLTHTSNDAGLTLHAKPGGGALSFTTSANFFIDYYHGGSGTGDALLSNYRISPHFKAAWKFLPKTAVFIESDLSITNYFLHPTAAIQSDFDFVFTVMAGANGNITPKLSAVLKAGYGDTFSEDSPYQSVVAMAELGYAISETAKISAGYVRGVQPSAIFEYTGTDNAHIRYTHLIAALVQIEAELGFTYALYGEDPSGTSTTQREDYRFSAKLGLDFYILEDWLLVGVQDAFVLNESNYVYPTNSLGIPGNSASFITNDVFVRAMVKY